MPDRTKQPDALKQIRRRGLITVAGACLLTPWRRASAFSGVITQAMAADLSTSNETLLVAGPAAGRLAQWAKLLCPLIGQAISAGGSVSWSAVGAADGVTAANQFDAQVSPDGNTALLLPGAAATAQLVGDPRARFEAGNWVAGFAGICSTLVMGRVPLSQLPTAVPLRVLAADPSGADLATLLGLSLLGYNVRPVNPLTIVGDGSAALLRGDADIATLSDAAVSSLPRWREQGLAALFSLGTIDETGNLARDPAYPDLPALQNLFLAKGGDPTHPLPTAWRALAAAKQLAMALVLPQLTPASRVAQWRQACAESIASLTIQAIAAAESLRFITQPNASAVISAITAPSVAQLELHQWLADRLGWRPA